MLVGGGAGNEPSLVDSGVTEADKGAVEDSEASVSIDDAAGVHEEPGDTKVDSVEICALSGLESSGLR